MNEGGYSWPEAVLTLAIVMIIFGSLLPVASAMAAQLHMKKAGVSAAETAFQGAVIFSAYGLTQGIRQVEEVAYQWEVKGQSICVYYRVAGMDCEKCVGI